MKTYFPLIICFSILLVALYARTPLRNSYEPTPSVMETFLTLDCAVNSSEEELIKTMRAQAEKAEVYFMDIVENGLPKEAVAAAQEHFAALYPVYLELIKDDSRKITIEDSKGEQKSWQPASSSQQAFVKQKTLAFEQRIIYRALEGLATLETNSAKEYLLKKASDKDFELALYAQELVEG